MSTPPLPLALRALALLCLLAAPAAAGPRLDGPATFEVRGEHAAWGAYGARLELTPGSGDEVRLRRALALEDGRVVVYAGRGTQEEHRVTAELAPARGASGALSGAAAGEPLRLVLDHDGEGRVRVRTLRGEEQVSLARGRAPGTPAARLDVAILSDLNGSYGSDEYGRAVHGAVRAVIERQPDLVLVTGDMVAGQLRGWGEAGNRERLRRTCRRMWSAFHAAVSDPLAGAGIALAPAPGNHDASVWRPHERRLYAEAWAERADLEFVDGEDFPFRYSFVKGGAFFLALDATRAGRLEHAAWVEEQLASPRAQACAVRVAYGHFPLHPTAERRRTAVLHGDLEQVFAEHDLTLYAAGHHHAYYPGAAGGVRQVVMACLGGGRRPLLGQRDRSPHSLVLLQVRGGGLTALEAFGGAGFDERLERAELPRRLEGLTRDDVAGFASEWAEAEPAE